MLAALRKLPELKDVDTDQQTAGLEIVADVDRDTAARLGVTMRDIDDTLYDAFGQRQVATTYTQLNQYRVVLEILPELGRDPEAINALYVQSATGGQVPLSALSKLRGGRGAAVGQPPGAVPVGDAVVQRRAERGARRGGGGDPSRRARDRPAGVDPRRLQRARRRRSRPRWRRSRC